MKPSGLVLALFLAVASGLALRADPDKRSPSDVAREGIHTAIEHFGFSPETLKFEKKWLTPDLYARLLKKANQPVPKGDAPDIDGDVFLDSQDLPTSFTLPPNGDSTFNGAMKIHAVTVSLVWTNEHRQYRVLLQEINGEWKVYGIDFGKDGKLTDLLK